MLSGGPLSKRRACSAVLCLAISASGCGLVLGIDEVSSANGPDSGQSFSAATAEPDGADAGAESDAAQP